MNSINEIPVVDQKEKKMAKIKYYGVRVGRTPGVYQSWEECKKQVDQFPGAIYKSFQSEKEAQAFVNEEVAEPKDTIRGVVAYVDGSVGSEIGSEYSYGVVILNGSDEYHISGKGNNPNMVSMRNVAGEIMGAMKAMQYAKLNGIKEITIVHDYQGIASWAKGEWKCNLDATKAYKDFYQKMSKHVKISFQKVKGHSGDYYNDLVDALAKRALGIKIKKALEEHIEAVEALMHSKVE
jgi:ribonuclease HI